jgi:histone deacetylase complex regulatory component SIN3
MKPPRLKEDSFYHTQLIKVYGREKAEQLVKDIQKNPLHGVSYRTIKLKSNARNNSRTIYPYSE